MKSIYSVIGRTVFGVLCCIATSLLISFLLADRPWRGFVPIAFVFVILLLASRFGLMVSVLGSIAAAMVFAWFLLPPLGSFRVSDPAERGNLAWMLLGGVVVPFLILPPPRGVDSDETKQAELHPPEQR